MIKTGLKRSENNVRGEFPEAIAEIKNFQLQNNRISFELNFYADLEAYNQVKKPVDVMAEPGAIFPENDGIVARKHFSEEASNIESLVPNNETDTLSAQLIDCCYSWLIKNHYEKAERV